MSKPIENCPVEEKPIRERPWTAEQEATHAAGSENMLFGATRCYGDDEWYREITVGGIQFLAPLDQQDVARQYLSARRAERKRAPLYVPSSPEAHGLAFVDGMGWVVQCSRATEYAATLRQQGEADHEFKNFHRLLCERFGYSHDDIDWKRDQISLIEWIAKPSGESSFRDGVKFASNVMKSYAHAEQAGGAVSDEVVRIACEAIGIPMSGDDPFIDSGDVRAVLEAVARLLRAPAEQGGRVECRFGDGCIGIVPGDVSGRPAVFLTEVSAPGEVGRPIPEGGCGATRIVLTFPTKEQADRVIAALAQNAQG